MSGVPLGIESQVLVMYVVVGKEGVSSDGVGADLVRVEGDVGLAGLQAVVWGITVCMEEGTGLVARGDGIYTIGIMPRKFMFTRRIGFKK